MNEIENPFLIAKPKIPIRPMKPILSLRRLLLSSVFLIAGSSLHGATTVTLDVAADVMIRTTSATTNVNGSEVIVGNTASGSGERLHGLVRFNTSTITIPVGFAIDVTSATLKTVNANSSGGGSNLTIEVYDYAYGFGETTATWNNPAGDGSDSTAGGTTGLLLSTLSNVNNAANGTNSFSSSANFISIVETAINGDDTVNLLLKRNTFSDANIFTRFLGDESGVGFQLDVTYDLVVIPEPHAALLGGLGFLLLLRRRR